MPATPVVLGNASYREPTFVSDTQLAFGTGPPSSLGDPGLCLKDLDAGGITLVPGNVDGGSSARLSGQGRQMVIQGSCSGGSCVFVRDRATGVEALASAGGAASNGSPGRALISRDGTQVVFISTARNLVSPRPPANDFQIYAKTVATASGLSQ